jgi:hypothetical protein
MGKNIEFQVDLSKWNDETGYWESDILRIPGVEVDNIYVNGRTVSDDDYKKSNRGIRWHNQSSRPSRITVDFILTKDFEKLATSDLFFKKLTAVLGISTLFLGIVVAINANKIATVKAPVSQSPASTLPPQVVSPPTLPVSQEATPTVSPPIVELLAPPVSQEPILPPNTENTYQKLYDAKKFPRATCGKVDNQEVNFVVFIPLNQANSKNIEKFCKDVTEKVKKWHTDKIQVAAFTNENDAEQLVDFMKRHNFGGVWRSEQK